MLSLFQIIFLMKQLKYLSVFIIAASILLFSQSCEKDDKNEDNTAQQNVPTITTAAVTNITQTTTISGGSISDEGETKVTVRGVCWHTDQTPCINDIKTEDGYGTGVFTSQITGLKPNTTYNIRAYATNSAGTGYGNTISFTTLESNVVGTFTDSRDGNVYKTVTIGNQVWMAENLNYDAGDGCWVYDNNPSNANTYGRLYDWETACTVSPDGWHLPTDDEWTELTNYLIANGYNYDSTTFGNKIGKSLATISGWDPNPTIGTIGNNQSSNNRTGFTALPSGWRRSNCGLFDGLNKCTFFWSATEHSSSNAMRRELQYNYPNLDRCYYDKSYGFSVRCLRN